MSNMNSFFDELVEAKKAMERLPGIEVELAKAQGERDVMRTRFEAECAHTLTQREIIANQDAAYAAKEAELDAATFRENELRTQLQMLTGLLKTVVGEANSAIEMVEPKPEPIVEALIENPTVAVDGQEQSASTPTADAAQGSMDSADTDAVSVPSDPTIPLTMEPDTSVASTTGMTTTSEATADTSTDLPGKFPWESPKIGDAEDHAYMYAPPTEAAVIPQENPTVHTGNTTVGAVDTIIEQRTDGAPASPSRPYWEKPTPTLWLDWRNSGGELAPWVKGMSDDQLKFAH